MRLINPLLFKKFIKEIIGINYLNKRITEVVVNKASYHKAHILEHDIYVLKTAINMLLKESDNIMKENIKKILSSMLSGSEYLSSSDTDKKFIFVCGLHRSGTSLFTKIMQEHPSINGFKNTGVIQDEGQFLQTVYLPDSDLGWPGSFGYSKDAHLTEKSELANEENRKKLYTQWSNFLDSNKDFIIEKSPPNLLKTRFLQALFPNSYFIVIRRNPIATCMATRKWSSSSMLQLIKHWLRCYDIWDEDKKYIQNYIEIKYEDFMKMPEDIIAQACEMCGIHVEDILSDTIKNYTLSNTVNQKYLNEWDGYWLQKKMVEIIYKNKIRKHGYSIVSEKTC